MEGGKKIVACFLLLLFGATAFSQDVYFVTMVKGNIKRTNGTPVKVGDKFPITEKLIFPKQDNKLILLHPQKGRFLLTPGTAKSEPSGEYLVYLKNSLLPSSERIKLSTRGEGGPEDFFTVNSAVNRNILFIGETAISLGNTIYNISDPKNDFFFIQYSPFAGKTVSNALKVRNDSLILNRRDFYFSNEERPDSAQFMIGFNRSSEYKKVSPIGSVFRPVFMSVEDCRAMMITIVQAIGKNKEKVLEEAMTVLCYNTGKTDKNVLVKLYDSL